MGRPLTEFCETLDDVLALAVTAMATDARLPAATIFPTTSYADLWAFLPEQSLPAAIVVYQGTRYYEAPHRAVHQVAVLLAFDRAADSDGAAGRQLVEAALAAIDQRVDGDIAWRVEGVDAVDVSSVDEDPICGAYLLRARAADH